MPDIRRIKARLEGLKKERQRYEGKWRDIGDFIYPEATAFVEDYDKEVDSEDDAILNSVPVTAHRILASGMQAGLTSPSRPWFRLDLPDQRLTEYPAVKDWLKRVEDMMYIIFAKSNFYDATANLYYQLSGPGNGAFSIFEDFETAIRCSCYSAGGYWLANDPKGRVNRFARCWKMTTHQMVSEFGLDRVSPQVRNSHNRGDYDTAWTVYQMIEPNAEMRKDAFGWRGKPFVSLWWEEGGSPDGFLRIGGFEEFPVMCPRWGKVDNRVYSRSPSWIALPDAKMLMKYEEAEALAIDRMVDPPLIAPSAAYDKLDLMPGGISFFDEQTGGQGVRSLYEHMNVPVQALDMKIAVIQERIKSVFFNDLFLMISMADKSGVTAREIAAKESEKLIMLGPVLESAKSEFLDPCIDRVFGIAGRVGLLPRPPKELEGMPLQVDYISILAQAQKLVGLSAMSDLVMYIGNGAQIEQAGVAKFDFDQYIDEVGHMLGVPPGVIRSDDEVAEIHAAQQQAMAQQQALEQAQAAANTAKTASETPVGESNALEALMNMSGGGQM